MLCELALASAAAQQFGQDDGETPAPATTLPLFDGRSGWSGASGAGAAVAAAAVDCGLAGVAVQLMMLVLRAVDGADVAGVGVGRMMVVIVARLGVGGDTVVTLVVIVERIVSDLAHLDDAVHDVQLQVVHAAAVLGKVGGQIGAACWAGRVFWVVLVRFRAWITGPSVLLPVIR